MQWSECIYAVDQLGDPHNDLSPSSGCTVMQLTQWVGTVDAMNTVDAVDTGMWTMWTQGMQLTQWVGTVHAVDAVEVDAVDSGSGCSGVGMQWSGNAVEWECIYGGCSGGNTML